MTNDEERQRAALIGDRVAHSRSPAIHNALAARYGLSLHYDLRPTPPGSLERAVNELRDGHHIGANITTPHKENVCALLDRLDSACERIGAVNTIIVEAEGVLCGANTDIAGITFVLEREPCAQRPFAAAVIGTGGAARAAVEALLAQSNLQSLAIHSRSAQRAVATASRWNDTRLRGAGLDRYAPVDIVIHATPLGMSGMDAVLGVDALRGTNVLVEMIYAPPATELIRRARAAGARTTGGMAMLVGQALEAFRLWTGVRPTLDDLPVDLLDELRACSVLW